MLNRLFSLALVAALAFGCVSNSLPDGADYRHRYFAAIADYSQAKRVALEYISLEDTPDEHVVALFNVVTRADFEVIRFEELRRAAQAQRADYVRTTRAVTLASDLLRAYAAGRQP
ncbi:MAG: hypothetical protein V3T08_10090 [Gemmatimonadota bacterium]